MMNGLIGEPGPGCGERRMIDCAYRLVVVFNAPSEFETIVVKTLFRFPRYKQAECS